MRPGERARHQAARPVLRDGEAVGPLGLGVDLSTSLTDELAALAALLPLVPTDEGPSGGPLDHLTRSVGLLHDDAVLAVGSMLGLSITMTVHGQEVVLTSMNDREPAATIAGSLLVPLEALSISRGGTVVFYAGRAGAFVDLAADLTHALHLDPDALLLDRHLSPRPVSGIVGVRELSLVNVAIGILIDRGHTPDDADQELARLARTSGLLPAQAAERLVAEVRQSSS